MKITDTIRLASGVEMPMLGFGTWKLKPDGEAQRAVAAALEIGYRHIDTASVYENEQAVGEGLRASGVPREEIFLTTKLWNDDIRGGREASIKAAHESLRLLRVEYFDLYLMHWPIAEHEADAWRAMEKLYEDGVARSIGVCNYMPEQMDRLLAGVDVKPMVDQVEFHPHLTQPELQKYLREKQIVEEAWSPIMQGNVDLPEIAEIAKRHGKSPAQIVLRWDLQHGIVTIPKSSHPTRIRENMELSTSSSRPRKWPRSMAWTKKSATAPTHGTFPSDRKRSSLARDPARSYFAATAGVATGFFAAPLSRFAASSVSPSPCDMRNRSISDGCCVSCAIAATVVFMKSSRCSRSPPAASFRVEADCGERG